LLHCFLQRIPDAITGTLPNSPCSSVEIAMMLSPVHCGDVDSLECLKTQLLYAAGATRTIRLVLARSLVSECCARRNMSRHPYQEQIEPEFGLGAVLVLLT